MEVPTTAEAASAPTKPEEDRSKMPQRRRLDLAITQYEKGDSGAVKTAKRALKIVREKRHYNRYLLRFLMGAKDKGFKLKEELRLSQEEALRVAWDQYVELRQQELKQRATLNVCQFVWPVIVPIYTTFWGLARNVCWTNNSDLFVVA